VIGSAAVSQYLGIIHSLRNAPRGEVGTLICYAIVKFIWRATVLCITIRRREPQKR